MRTVRTRIFLPMFISVTSIITLSFAVLNISARRALDGVSIQSQMITMQSMKSMQLSWIYRDKLNSTTAAPDVPAPDEDISTLRSGLIRASIPIKTELIALKPDSGLLFPRSLEYSFLTQELLSETQKRIAGVPENSVIAFSWKWNRYFASYKTIQSDHELIKIILISSGHTFSVLIHFMNGILTGILFIAIAACLIVSICVSKKIAHPFNTIALQSERIGNGDYTMLPDDTSTKEANSLTAGINHMILLLADSDRTNKLFLQNASHELRTPLMSIQGYAEGLKTGVFTDIKAAATIIIEESSRMHVLVSDLLTISRLDSHSYALGLQSCTLTDVIRGILSGVSNYAMFRSVELRFAAVPQQISFMSDLKLLEQIISNILTNCIRYAAHSVLITAGIKSNTVQISIRDDGPGISAEDLPHIFDRFYKGKGGNTGLGLAIAKSAADYLNGTIRVCNDCGAVFTVTLPICNY